MSNSFYSNARAKYLTNNLLGLERLKRMIESNLEDAIKVLQETDFGHGEIISSSLEFEKILYKEEKNLLDFIRETCPDENFKKFFLLKYDYHNAEALIKAKYLKIDPEKMLVCHGIYQSAFMAEKIMNDDYRFFPKTMGDALYKCDVLFVNETATGDVIGDVIKGALYDELSLCSRENALLKKLFVFSVDMQNVSLALRTKDFLRVKKSFLKGGSISLSELQSLCEESIDVLKEKVKFFSNGNVIQLALDALVKQQPFSDFERLVDGYALSFLKEKKYSTDGIIPFMLYCYYKINEIKNVRIILVGLLNGLDKNEIERRLINTYEG